MSHFWGCSIKTNCGDDLDDKELPSLSLGGSANLFSKGPKVTLLDSQLLSSTVVEQMQPKTPCKRISVSVFQENFIHKNRRRASVGYDLPAPVLGSSN